MNTNTLRYVIAVAEEKNFTKAARRLYIAQPSLSQSIQTLEKQLGTPLFDRSTTPLRLTYAGEEYVNWARKVLNSETQTLRRIGDIAGNSRRKLIVGVSPYRSLRILPEVLKRFYEETQGECTVSLVEQRSSDYMKLLEEGKLDLLIDRPTDPDGPYESVFLAEEKLIIGVPEQYAVPPEKIVPGGGGILTLGRLRQEDARFLGQLTEEEMHINYETILPQALQACPAILLSEKQRIGRAWREAFEWMGSTPPTVLECQSIEMAFLMVRQGLGMTLLPETVIRFMPPAPQVRYYIMKDHPLSRTMAVLYSRTEYLGNDAKKFIGLLQDVLS